MSSGVCEAPRTPKKGEFCVSSDRKHSSAKRWAGLDLRDTAENPAVAMPPGLSSSGSQAMALVLCSDFYVSGPISHSSTEGCLCRPSCPSRASQREERVEKLTRPRGPREHEGRHETGTLSFALRLSE